MITNVSLALFTACVLHVCVDAAACTPTDSWERLPPNAASFFANKLPASSYSEVEDSMKAHAKAILESVPIKEITKTAAQKLSNGRLKPPAGARVRYFLVRAVKLVQGGKFTAYRDGSSIYILHSDLGAPRPSKQSAVVVATDGELLQAFTSCGTAE